MFEKGQSGNPAGRPKGARSRLSEAFLRDIAEHWAEHGPEALRKTFEESPSTYLRVVASLIPRDVNLDVNASKPIVSAEPMDLDAWRAKHVVSSVPKKELETHHDPGNA